MHLVEGADAGYEVRLVGDQTEDPYLRVVFTQNPCHSGGRTRRAHAGDEPVRCPPLQILDDLRAGARRVRLGVARVEVLVGMQIRAARLGERLVEAGQRIVRVGGVQALALPGQFLDLGAQQEEQLLDLQHPHPVGDALEAQSVHPGEQGECLGRVAAGEFHDRLTALGRRLQMRAGHVPGRPVLDGAEGIEHLQLRVQVEVAQAVHGRVDAHQRRCCRWPP
ncbi:hypothetical protein SPAR_30136 [Streptomyces sparsogenes DSM 40356]|uniref:Uncharacterized protein n=1 Tax=Streptomyces sparsogenes DSM 40356 TaxID=1331668 RepID=A0A1R1SBB7_9ACTN|nr:hypothetical protein SPAR_30136 [Streptomyces sparsogenes DSM 40356]